MYNITKIKTQLIVGAIALGLLLCTGLIAKHYYDANLISQEKIKEIADANKTLTREIDLLKESRRINDEIITKQQDTIDKIVALNGEHKAQVSKEVKKILDKYGKLPSTPENHDAQAAEISTVRISGLWKTYCVSHPKYEECEQFRKEQQ